MLPLCRTDVKKVHQSINCSRNRSYPGKPGSHPLAAAGSGARRAPGECGRSSPSFRNITQESEEDSRLVVEDMICDLQQVFPHAFASKHLTFSLIFESSEVKFQGWVSEPTFPTGKQGKLRHHGAFSPIT